MTIDQESATATCHYWHPIPEPDGKRHAFRGARRWPGQSSGEAVCDTTVPMAVASDVDWFRIPTCMDCWSVLLSDQETEQ